MFFRIQSLFLTIAAGLLVSMFFAPMIRFVGEDTVIRFVEVAAFKGFTLTTIFQLVCAVLSIVTLVSFKNRIRQIRLCNLNTLILIAYQIILAVYFFQRDTKLGEDAIFTVPCLFPICAAILTFIAMRYIARDEAMVIASTRRGNNLFFSIAVLGDHTVGVTDAQFSGLAQVEAAFFLVLHVDEDEAAVVVCLA